jgi:ABC-type Zn uptake system ZnuABC Zn-binding protein ZnuA
MWTILWIVALTMAACGQPDQGSENPDRLKVVATTSIVGDVVSNVGREMIDLIILLPLGVDPHGYDPSPQDIVKISEADVVFANGAGLEEFLEPMLESAGAVDKVVQVSESISSTSLEDESGGVDPHTWMSPKNVMKWVETIELTLSQLDPANAENYQSNAAAYRAELTNLDEWIRQQVAAVAVENRNIVTDHANFGYFADAYGFLQAGTIITGYSTMSEPSAQSLAALEDAVRELGVKAIFVGNTVNPGLAERIAEDTGTRLVFVYTGSLSEPGGDADSYINYMKFNTGAFVNNLK